MTQTMTMQQHRNGQTNKLWKSWQRGAWRPWAWGGKWPSHTPAAKILPFGNWAVARLLKVGPKQRNLNTTTASAWQQQRNLSCGWPCSPRGLLCIWGAVPIWRVVYSDLRYKLSFLTIPQDFRGITQRFPRALIHDFVILVIFVIIGKAPFSCRCMIFHDEIDDFFAAWNRGNPWNHSSPSPQTQRWGSIPRVLQSRKLAFMKGIRTLLIRRGNTQILHRWLLEFGHTSQLTRWSAGWGNLVQKVLTILWFQFLGSIRSGGGSIELRLRINQTTRRSLTPTHPRPAKPKYIFGPRQLGHGIKDHTSSACFNSVALLSVRSNVERLTRMMSPSGTDGGVTRRT